MTRPAPFLVIILGLTMVVAACEATPQTSPAPDQTQLPGVDTPAPDPGSTPAAPDGTPAGPGDTPAGPGDTPGPGATAPPVGVPGGILAAVQARGTLVCGVNGGLPGFSFLEEGTGTWSGFDVDYCRAVAQAVLGNPDAVQYRPLGTDDRGPALQFREVDVLIRNTTWTVQRDAEWGLFAPTTFYDGQGIMVRSAVGATTLEELGNATICVQSGTTTELNLADAMAAAGHEGNYTTQVFDNIDETYNTYESGACDAVTSDRSQLVSRRTQMATPTDHVLLETVMSKEPLGPATPRGDDQWFNVVKWTVFATFEAEELGITQANVTEMRDTSENPVVQRLLGTDPEGTQGTKLGLANDWVVGVISAVGNYGEIFERNVGPNTTLGLDRGLNRLWTDDPPGLIYAPPYR
jgi:general L-amino acid transport system substrate-binding protein